MLIISNKDLFIRVKDLDPYKQKCLLQVLSNTCGGPETAKVLMKQFQNLTIDTLRKSSGFHSELICNLNEIR